MTTIAPIWYGHDEASETTVRPSRTLELRCLHQPGRPGGGRRTTPSDEWVRLRERVARLQAVVADGAMQQGLTTPSCTAETPTSRRRSSSPWPNATGPPSKMS